MYLSFCDNVYLVEGKSKDCIYDLNNGKLYHLKKQGSELIKKLSINSFEITENSFIKFLIDNKLVRFSSKKSELLDIKSIGRESKIEFAWIEICDTCNLKCIHCYNESSIKSTNKMSLDDFENVCLKLKEIDINKIQIIGGEPLLHPQIKEILLIANKYFDKIEVFTNGTLLNNELADLIKLLGINVALSVYSYKSEEHDKVTQVKGSHSKTTKAIALLNKKNIPYRIATVHMKGIDIGKRNTNLYSINKYKDVIRLTGRGDKNMLTPYLLRKRLITKKTFTQPINFKDISTMVMGHQCFSKRLYISATLDVYPCVMERRLCHGNIKNSSIFDILNKDILYLNKDKITECNNCEFRYACFDCRPNTIGNINSKPYYCTYDVSNGIWYDIDDFVEKFFQ